MEGKRINETLEARGSERRRRKGWKLRVRGRKRKKTTEMD